LARVVAASKGVWILEVRVVAVNASLQPAAAKAFSKQLKISRQPYPSDSLLKKIRRPAFFLLQHNKFGVAAVGYQSSAKALEASA